MDTPQDILHELVERQRDRCMYQIERELLTLLSDGYTIDQLHLIHKVGQPPRVEVNI